MVNYEGVYYRILLNEDSPYLHFMLGAVRTFSVINALRISNPPPEEENYPDLPIYYAIYDLDRGLIEEAAKSFNFDLVRNDI